MTDIDSTPDNATDLLTVGFAVWAYTILAFAFLYWVFDGGGPDARLWAPPEFPNLAFPEQLNPVVAPPGWRPQFFDYLYLGFTDATAFSPTDVMPLARWAKAAMTAGDYFSRHPGTGGGPGGQHLAVTLLSSDNAPVIRFLVRGGAMIPGVVARLPGSDVTHGEESSDMARTQDDHLWALAHAERAALAKDLAGLGAEQWRHDTLCGEWDVEQVVAHLTAAADLNQWRWLRSMLGARFRPDVHNQRRMAEHLGSTPAETLDRFRAVITSTTAPSSHTPAYLGEVVVHAQDIRQPLGLVRTPSVDALTPVADFFARRDFTVASRTRIADLQLRADDGPFATGTGLLVTGSTLALVMSMAGRVPYLAELDGPGVPTLRSRLEVAAV